MQCGCNGAPYMWCPELSCRLDASLSNPCAIVLRTDASWRRYAPKLPECRGASLHPRNDVELDQHVGQGELVDVEERVRRARHVAILLAPAGAGVALVADVGDVG